MILSFIIRSDFTSFRYYTPALLYTLAHALVNQARVYKNGYHVAWGPAAVAAVAPVTGPEGAPGAVPAPGPAVSLEAVPAYPAESPAGAAVVAVAAAAAEGAAALVVIRGGRDGSRI